MGKKAKLLVFNVFTPITLKEAVGSIKCKNPLIGVGYVCNFLPFFKRRG